MTEVASETGKKDGDTSPQITNVNSEGEISCLPLLIHRRTRTAMVSFLTVSLSSGCCELSSLTTVDRAVRSTENRYVCIFYVLHTLRVLEYPMGTALHVALSTASTTRK